MNALFVSHYKRIKQCIFINATTSVPVSPVLVLPHPQISQALGKDTLLDCLVTANPLDSVKWVKDGQEVVDGPRHLVRAWQVWNRLLELSRGVFWAQTDRFIEYC